MVRLHNLLSVSSKARRHRRNILNIQITILAWLVEFFGFFTIFLGSFILGHENSIITLTLQTLTLLIYFIIIPCTFWISDSHLKAIIAESNWYLAFINMFNCQSTNPIEEENDNEGVNNQIEEDDDNEDGNNQIEEDDGNENVNDGGIQQCDRQNPNLPNLTHQIIPSSKGCIVIDLEANEDV